MVNAAEISGTPSQIGTSPPERIRSIDALRGLVMFVMIFVNDLGDVHGSIVPAWMKHFRGENGMTFVDLVFPGFLFIVGMSIPFALDSRRHRGESLSRTLLHILARAGALLFIGILMVNGLPDPAKMGWSGSWWLALVFLSAILAFCDVVPSPGSDVSPERARYFRLLTRGARSVGLIALVFLAFVFRNKNGVSIITLAPFNIRHLWYGILGYIGWSYLLSSVLYLVLGKNRIALLGALLLLLCLYPAHKMELFKGLWIAKHINLGGVFGSRAVIAGWGLLLGVMLASTRASAPAVRVRLTLLLIAGCGTAAWLLGGLYGIRKDNATPSWALWGTTATAALWLIIYFISDVRPVECLARPLTMAGQNVLLAYLISESIPSVLEVAGLASWYDNIGQLGLPYAIVRSALCSLIILSAVVRINRLGFRLRL